MTLIVAITGPESIWLLADRRLSYATKPPKDDGRKFMFLETTDGVAILGYAGLGATTGLGTEPSDWMSAVLRGRNLPMEESLGVLAKAMQEQLPQHMMQMPGKGRPTHHVIIPVFVGEEQRFYSIDLVPAPDQKSYEFRYARRLAESSPTDAPRTPRLGIGGTGAPYLMKKKNWMRELLRVVRANDRGKISPRAVADHLAVLNNDVHLAVTDKSVGPRCIVAWRFRKGGVHNGGGGQQFYTGPKRDANSTFLPIIGHGMDISALLEAMMPNTMKTLEAMRAGEPAQDPDEERDEINAILARLPTKPDEKLR